MATTPVEIVQRQVQAYNAHDLEAFAATYSDSIEMFRMPNATDPIISGKDELKEFYGANRFMSPSLNAEIVNRIVVGNKVIDHERITGLPQGTFEVVVIYEVTAGLIQRVWSLWPE
jgi:hypothetical protein